MRNDPEQVIRRVQRMEIYLDALQQALCTAPHLLADGPLEEMLRALTAYYEDGRWRADFEADEKGLLPHDLKRGVLSEDTVYNLLTEIAALRRKDLPQESDTL